MEIISLWVCQVVGHANFAVLDAYGAYFQSGESVEASLFGEFR